MSNVALLTSVDDKGIVEICSKLAHTDCHPMPSLGTDVAYL
jgi:hypothetical protein